MKIKGYKAVELVGDCDQFTLGTRLTRGDSPAEEVFAADSDCGRG